MREPASASPEPLASPPPWDVIVVSAASQSLANAACAALAASSPHVRHARLLAVADPSPTHRVGSGGAVLNALLAVGEELSARAGLSTLSAAPLLSTRLLILQLAAARGGTPHPCLPQALTALPARPAGVASGVCLCVHAASLLFARLRAGVAVASTASLLALPPHPPPLEWDERHAGLVLAAPLPPAAAAPHGVCDASGRVAYRAGEAALAAAAAAAGGAVPVYAAVLCLSAAVGARLLELHVLPPLDACTCRGVDSGAPPLRLELHEDVLAPLAAAEAEECAPVADERRQARGAGEGGRAARRVLWEGLRAQPALGKLQLRVVDCAFLYLHDSGAHQRLLLAPPARHALLASPCGSEEAPDDGSGSFLSEQTREAWPQGVRSPPRLHSATLPLGHIAAPRLPYTSPHLHLFNPVHCWTPPPLGQSVALACVLYGVRVGTGCALVQCSLAAGTTVGDGAFLYGVHSPPTPTNWPAGLVAHEVLLTDGAAIVFRHSSDQVHLDASDGAATFLSRPWEALLEADLPSHSLWGAGVQHSLWHATLFPLLTKEARASRWGLASWWRAVRWLFTMGREGSLEEWESWERVSFADCAERVDALATVTFEQSLACEVSLAVLRAQLLRGAPTDLRAHIRRLAEGASLASLLATLDELASASPPQLAARAFAAQAEALAMRAGQAGGLRSGPASNAEWVGALAPLKEGKVGEATAALAALRDAWTADGQPRQLVRAARHYEGAVAECTSLCVKSCAVHAAPCAPLPQGAWVVCEAPCRVDLAGGWSDTPPICYEHTGGGRVINAAITVDGACPIGAKCRRLALPILRFSVDEGASFLEYSTLGGLTDYLSPLAPAALVKCVCLFCGVFSLRAHAPPLEAQLRAAGGGLEVASWSRLPTGSGLGTSSILAAALVRCVGRATGKEYAPSELTHAVLQVEQMLTTGGGWQDQAGGLFPALKRCSSAAALPLAVEARVLAIPAAALRLLSSHLALVYTGKTRLARNLLQDVLRRWYSGNPCILANVRELVENAEAMEEALLRMDIAAVGECLDRYWAQKKVMCDAEPEAVTRMLSKVRHLVHGATLAGAGGGGFMLLITKAPNATDEVAQALADECCVMHQVAIDTVGLRTSILSE
ncbi:hypothetical protein AB1Y20_005327 [Prymnesium parvum]|uniref:L-fucose kinase n=1 Tax=Prymnesium parvum TaxID=97485 RepID=A0AB34J329_PRYPA